MKILVDMNLSPEWVAIFAKHGIAAVHWSTVGKPGRGRFSVDGLGPGQDHILFTHDLDFGAMLAF